MKSGIGMYKKFGDFEYRGGFIKDKFDGIGRLHLVNGEVYEGLWKDGEYNGTGKYEWPDHSVYSG